jgi:hypothetical protein
MRSCCRAQPAESLIDDYEGENMNDLSRRRFLHSSFGVAMVGAIAVVPGLTGVLKLSKPQAAGGAKAMLAGPLVAHVRDLATGEISLLVGTNHVVHRDRELAARLYAAAQQAQ